MPLRDSSQKFTWFYNLCMSGLKVYDGEKLSEYFTSECCILNMVTENRKLSPVRKAPEELYIHSYFIRLEYEIALDILYCIMKDVKVFRDVLSAVNEEEVTVSWYSKLPVYVRMAIEIIAAFQFYWKKHSRRYVKSLYDEDYIIRNVLEPAHIVALFTSVRCVLLRWSTILKVETAVPSPQTLEQSIRQSSPALRNLGMYH